MGSRQLPLSDGPGAVAAEVRRVQHLAVLAGHLDTPTFHHHPKTAGRHVVFSLVHPRRPCRRSVPHAVARSARPRHRHHVVQLRHGRVRNHVHRQPAQRPLQRKRPHRPSPQPEFHRGSRRTQQRPPGRRRRYRTNAASDRADRRRDRANAVAADELRRPRRQHRHMRQRIHRRHAQPQRSQPTPPTRWLPAAHRAP